MTETTATEAARDLAIVRRGRAAAHPDGVVAELRVGALLGGGKRALARTADADDVVATIPLLPYGVAVAGAHAALLAEDRAQVRPRGAHDLIIAATARAGGRTVVTAGAAALAGLPGVAVLPHR